MNYMISFVNEEGFDWCLYETTNYDKAYDFFNAIAPPPGWSVELRETDEDVDVFISYTVLDRRDF